MANARRHGPLRPTGRRWRLRCADQHRLRCGHAARQGEEEQRHLVGRGSLDVAKQSARTSTTSSSTRTTSTASIRSSSPPSTSTTAKNAGAVRGYGNGQVLLLADQGLLLVLGEKGEVALEADPEKHAVLGKFKAIEGKTWNHPVVAGGRLFVRNGEEIGLLPTPCGAVEWRSGAGSAATVNRGVFDMTEQTSPAVQDYLKAIHALDGAERTVKPHRYRRPPPRRAPSVTGMLKRLADAGWIDNAPGQGRQPHRRGRRRSTPRHSPAPARRTVPDARPRSGLERGGCRGRRRSNTRSRRDSSRRSRRTSASRSRIRTATRSRRVRASCRSRDLQPLTRSGEASASSSARSATTTPSVCAAGRRSA